MMLQIWLSAFDNIKRQRKITSEFMTTPTEPTQETVSILQNAKPAWSPTAIAWISILFSFFPSCVMYALNFERLEKSKRKKRTLVFISIVTILYHILIIPYLLLPDYDRVTELRIRSCFFVINILFAWYFYLRQQNLFVRYMQSGGRKASLKAPVLLIVVWMLLLLGGTTFYVIQRDEKEFNRALALLDNEKYGEAEVIFKQIKSSNPDETSAYWNLAIIYSETDRLPLAKQELTSLLKYDPDNKEAEEWLKELEEQ